MDTRTKISIIVPFHWMAGWQFFLTRCLESIERQTFKDYEVILTKAGSMPVNTNRAIQCAKGELIKVLYMDDYLAHENSLQEIVDNFKEEDVWMITGCNTNSHPYWTEDIETGNNKLGSPSCLTFRNNRNILFNEELSWLLDVELYIRLYENICPPKILDTINIIIGEHSGQMTHILTDEQKLVEQNYLKQKYGK